MRLITTLLLLVFIFSACQPTNTAEETPTDLAGKKALLIEKNKELQALSAEIDELRKEILELDPSSAENKKLVTTIPVQIGTFQKFAEIQGNVMANETAAAAAEVPGRITKLTVKEGDRVKTGQLIAELDLEQLNKQIDELNKSLELAEDIFTRQERLWKQNIGSEIQYLEAKNNVERLKKSKETIAFQLTKSKVYAPIGGIVEMVNMEPGELAMTGAPIISILSMNRLKVVADLPENYLQTVSRGDKVALNYPALDMDQEARINLIGSTINPSNRTFKIEINTGNPGNKLKPNLLALVKIKDYEEKDVVIIPLDLVQQEVGGKKFVMITQQDGEELKAKKVYVQTGESYDGQTIITDGLTGAEALIEKGARGLGDADPIEIFNPKSTANNG